MLDAAGVLVWCKVCQHHSEADLRQLVDTGRGDVPLIHRFPPYGAAAGTTLMLLKGEPLISFVLTTV